MSSRGSSAAGGSLALRHNARRCGVIEGFRDLPAHRRRRIAVLTFLHDHVIVHENYRLSHGDFKLLEIGPDALRLFGARR